MTTPTVGALRWDAWYSTAAGAPALSTAIALGDSDLQQYAPVHLKQANSYTLSAVPATQAVVDNEITVAAANGLSYWAYLMYSASVPGMMNAWNYHQTSSIKANMPWCAMLQLNMMGTTGSYSTQVAQFVTWFQQSNYFTVPGGKPLVYIYWVPADLTTYWGGSAANVAAMITALRAATVAAGLPTPYIVVMNGAETTVYTALGADAISNYITSLPNAIDRTYAQLDTTTQAYWATMAATAVPIVPICMSGWTRQGRARRPVPWEATTQRPYFGLRRAYGRPTAAELKAHIASARTYVGANPTVVPSNTILLYAWNECDEGHPICPTIGTPAGMALV